MNTIDCPKCQRHHEPSGEHEADSGEHTCQECGFKFTCEIEYDPDYITSCVEHVWGPFMRDTDECKYCHAVKEIRT